MPAGDIEAAQPEPTLLQQSSHPTALIFHLLFRVAAVFMYIFSGLFTSNSILTFVIIILLLAFDFWTVKNVTGRLLVGLRWWNEIREDGTNQWIFESRENGVPNAVDSRIFWTALYVAPAVWALLAVLALLRMQWGSLIVTLVAVAMCSANLFGYMQCEKDAKKRAASYIANQGIFTNIVGSMISTRIGAMFGSR
ncbi:vesicle-mediated transport [Polyrhizophydium stewartii]|uniref:Golgi apparatus membrane protein TVP23 n=1 Tax=Polyrhizophydium stewartii TaxID=2732419 RepID=A0ABR4NAQ3_9FUNG